MTKSIDAFAVFEDEDIWMETLADTPMEAVQAIDDQRINDPGCDSFYARMIAGKIKVMQVRVDVVGVAEIPEPEPESAPESPTEELP